MKFKSEKGQEYVLPDISMWVDKLSPIEKQRVLAGHLGVNACQSLWKWFGFGPPVPRSLTPVPENNEHATE
jgi:hypothetical protein